MFAFLSPIFAANRPQSGPPPVDPGFDAYRDDVVFYASMEGQNGSALTPVNGNGQYPFPFQPTLAGTVTHERRKFGQGGFNIFQNETDVAYRVESGSTLTFGYDDFTIDFWIYVESAPGAVVPIISHGGKYPWNAYGCFSVSIDVGNKIIADMQENFFNPRITTRRALSTANWHHVAVTRHNGLFCIWLDGQLERAGATNVNLWTNDNIFTIGSAGLWPGSKIFIDDVRITKGRARYVMGFTPPSEAFPTTNDDPYFNNVGLLLKGEGEHDGTIITDSSTFMHQVTVFGDTRISTTNKKYGLGSVNFDGNADYMTIENHPSTQLGTNPFTIEAWIYSTREGDGGVIIEQAVPDEGAGNNIGWILFVRDGKPAFGDGGGGLMIPPSLPAGIQPITNRWVHIALVATEDTISLHVDGLLAGTCGPFNMNLALDIRPDTPTIIGVHELVIQNSNTFFQGYIDELRVTKGIARYPFGFTVPTAPPNYGS